MRCLKITPMTTLLILFASTCLAADVPPDEASTAFFRTYCLRCHDAHRQAGQFRLDSLPRDFVDQATAERWSEVVFRMNSGEMPPKDEPQPKAEELGRVVVWIAASIAEGRATRMARRGPVSLYRLSRDEYSHQVPDPLGVHFDGKRPGALNEDPRWHGFDRIGALLTLSPSHVDRCLRAADTISEETQRKRDGIFPVSLARNAKAPEDPQQLEALFSECRRSLHRFTERALRRPVTRDEVERYVRIVQEELAAGESFGPAYLPCCLMARSGTTAPRRNCAT